jgi:hypothetical protein
MPADTQGKENEAVRILKSGMISILMKKHSLWNFRT